jgi:hypothetical protein
MNNIINEYFTDSLLIEKNNKIIELGEKIVNLENNIKTKSDENNRLKIDIDKEKDNTQFYINKFNKSKSDKGSIETELNNYKNKLINIETKYNECHTQLFENNDNNNIDFIDISTKNTEYKNNIINLKNKIKIMENKMDNKNNIINEKSKEIIYQENKNKLITTDLNKNKRYTKNDKTTIAYIYTLKNMFFITSFFLLCTISVYFFYKKKKLDIKK